MSTVTQPLAVPAPSIAGLLRDYAELIKLRVTTLIVMTAWCGYYFGCVKAGVPSLSWGLFHALLGIGMVSGGTAALNEVLCKVICHEIARLYAVPYSSWVQKVGSIRFVARTLEHKVKNR